MLKNLLKKLFKPTVRIDANTNIEKDNIKDVSGYLSQDKRIIKGGKNSKVAGGDINTYNENTTIILPSEYATNMDEINPDPLYDKKFDKEATANESKFLNSMIYIISILFAGSIYFTTFPIVHIIVIVSFLTYLIKVFHSYKTNPNLKTKKKTTIWMVIKYSICLIISVSAIWSYPLITEPIAQTIFTNASNMDGWILLNFGHSMEQFYQQLYPLPIGVIRFFMFLRLLTFVGVLTIFLPRNHKVMIIKEFKHYHTKPTYKFLTDLLLLAIYILSTHLYIIWNLLERTISNALPTVL